VGLPDSEPEWPPPLFTRVPAWRHGGGGMRVLTAGRCSKDAWVWHRLVSDRHRYQHAHPAPVMTHTHAETEPPSTAPLTRHRVRRCLCQTAGRGRKKTPAELRVDSEGRKAVAATERRQAPRPARAPRAPPKEPTREALRVLPDTRIASDAWPSRLPPSAGVAAMPSTGEATMTSAAAAAADAALLW
jgi:hypothetical protein